METVRFEDLQLDERILRVMTDMGFEAVSPIQAQVIPTQLKGIGIIGQAQTGAGKTAVFGIPSLQKIDPKKEKLQTIALCPTRELAIQIAEEVRKLTKYMHRVKVVPIHGEQGIVRQVRSLKDGTQIAVSTPGRIMDHMRRKTIKCDGVRTVIMSEADEMLNMGFLEDMETILSQLPEERQTVIFSATAPSAIQDIAKKFRENPVIVKIVKKELTVLKVAQYYYEVKPKTRLEVMCRLLDLYAPKLSVAFCNTRRQIDELVRELQGRGYFAEDLRGDLKQIQRDRAMSSFRNGKTETLVAMGVATRGIDVDNVEAVFNYDIPQDDKYYVHRIGRTGRADHEGTVFSFVIGEGVYKLRGVQRYRKTRIVPQPIPSLNDITAIRVDKILEQITDIINDNDLSEIVDLVGEKLLEEDYTSTDLATAPLRMSMGEDNEDIIENGRTARSLDDLDNYGYDGRDDGRGGRSGGRGNSGRRDSGRDGGRSNMARLFINIGKSQNIRPGDILGATTGESGMPGKMAGSIDTYDRCTFVEVPRENTDAILDVMKNVKIKGKSVHMEKANGKGR